MGKKEFNLDEGLKRLEEINARIASSDISLDESIKLYSEGSQLADQCRKQLEGIETQLRIVNEEDEQDIG